MPGRVHRSIRERLYAADPHCHWCRRLTRWVTSADGRLPDDAATLDHFRSRLDPLRGKIAGEPRHVLACRKCNHDRGEKDVERFRPETPPRVNCDSYSDLQPLRAAINEVLRQQDARYLRKEQAEYTALLQEVTARLKNEDTEVAA